MSSRRSHPHGCLFKPTVYLHVVPSHPLLVSASFRIQQHRQNPSVRSSATYWHPKGTSSIFSWSLHSHSNPKITSLHRYSEWLQLTRPLFQIGREFVIGTMGYLRGMCSTHGWYRLWVLWNAKYRLYINNQSAAGTWPDLLINLWFVCVSEIHVYMCSTSLLNSVIITQGSFSKEQSGELAPTYNILMESGNKWITTWSAPRIYAIQQFQGNLLEKKKQCSKRVV